VAVLVLGALARAREVDGAIDVGGEVLVVEVDARVDDRDLDAGAGIAGEAAADAADAPRSVLGRGRVTTGVAAAAGRTALAVARLGDRDEPVLLDVGDGGIVAVIAPMPSMLRPAVPPCFRTVAPSASPLNPTMTWRSPAKESPASRTRTKPLRRYMERPPLVVPVADYATFPGRRSNWIGRPAPIRDEPGRAPFPGGSPVFYIPAGRPMQLAIE
jgi:hypothetical protein